MTIIDLTNFTGERLYQTFEMFAGCTNLTTIVCKNDWTIDKTFEYNELDNLYANMFTNCTKLIGDNGTHYDENHNNLLYAHPDMAGNPGYFSADATTGIKGIQKVQGVQENIYNLSGQRQSKLAKGINIVSGKKIIVKSQR